DIAQTVTITGVNDAATDGAVAYSIITGDVSSTDAAFDALTADNVADVSVTNPDKETAGVSVTTTTQTTTAYGRTATFSLERTSQPTGTVTIPISSADPTEGTVSVTSLTFTVDNWNVPQTVTITGVNDQLDDGDVTYAILTGDPTSSDAAYNALTNTDVADVN